MRRIGLLALLSAAVALAAVDRGVAAPAIPPYPADLRVAGGENAWQADPRFSLTWSGAPSVGGPQVAAVGYRLRDASGTLLREVRLDGDRTLLEVEVPTPPGAYAIEVWLEGPGGERGPAANAALRYDYRRPGVPQAIATDRWIAADTPAAISIRPPVGPLPVSGIGGYAVAVDRGGESRPCASRDRCREDEIDLRPASEGHALSLGTLPEGLSIVRVVAVSGAGVPSAEAGSAMIRVDATHPDVVLTGVPDGWVAEPPRVAATATDSLSGMAPDGPNGPITAIAVDHGIPRVELGHSAALTVTGEGIHRLAAHSRDAAGNVGDGRPQTAVVAIDETPPWVAFVSKQDPAEPERIEATAADPLSGVAADRGSIAIREANTTRPWRALPTKQAGGRLVARWSSDADPEGVYEFRATVYDAAGNAASSSRRANHTRMVLLNPLKKRTRLRAEFAGRDDAAKTVRFGHGALYGGRLTSATGAPLGDFPVRVVESFGANATLSQRSTGVVTKADGSFALRLPPGPSREVRAIFEGTRTLSRADGGQARLSVLAGIGLRASARAARVGGAPVVFSGRVRGLGARLPIGGLAVELQFRIAGGDWAEFRTVQTDARGRFRYPYAFSDDDSRGVRFRFRAYISGGGWPYEPAASKTVSVTGR